MIPHLEGPRLMLLKTAYSLFLPHNASVASKVHFAKRLAHTHAEMCLFARASKISVDHHHAEKRDKKGIMKIDGQREGIMIGLLLMEVWR